MLLLLPGALSDGGEARALSRDHDRWMLTQVRDLEVLSMPPLQGSVSMVKPRA